MANYTPSNLVTAQAKLIQNFESNEKRYIEPVTFNSIKRTSQIMFPNSRELRVREDRAIDAYYKTRTSRALGTGRAHDHTGSRGDSAILSPSWITYSDKFVTTLKGADNNIYSADELLTNELENVFINMIEGHEQIATEFLFNNRSQVNTNTSGGAFDGVNFVFEIAEATEGNTAIQISKIMMHNNAFSGSYTVYCDSDAFRKFNFQANQGVSNDTNLAFQFSGMTFVHSTKMDALASGLGYDKGLWAVVPEGSVAVLDWIPVQNRAGHEDTEGMYGQIANPIDGLSYAVHSYKERIDGTSINGYTQDVKTEWEASIDLAFEFAPSTTANSTPILVAALV
jgi:hypothetical protein